jgi:hypothetical protein
LRVLDARANRRNIVVRLQLDDLVHNANLTTKRRRMQKRFSHS